MPEHKPFHDDYAARPLLIDVFAGAGGSAMGYYQAGFRILGVDNRPQPHYPFAFIQMDAFEFFRRYMAGEYEEAEAFHASPPCQDKTRAGKLRDAQGAKAKYPDLLTPTRDILMNIGVPWVIENVPGAPMRVDIVLCGSMFGLSVRRHRWFEFSEPPLPLVSPCNHHDQGRPIGVYHRMRDDIPHGGRTAKSLAEASTAMGIGWMTWDELKEAIPPVYTRYIGAHLLTAVRGQQERHA